MMQKVSIIIPACNEENYLKKTIDSLRNQDYQNLEIIVVVNGSRDKTFEIAKEYADKAFSFSEPLGPARARNEGVKKAEGDILVFLDADTLFSKNVVGKIVEAANLNLIGTCSAKSSIKSVRAYLFFFVKNLIHRLKIYKGTNDGVIFFPRDIFLKTGGFEETKLIAEFRNLIRKAIKLGCGYKCLSGCYAMISPRRYEKEGYFKTIFYWIKWGINTLFKRGDKVAAKYWSDKGKGSNK